MIIDQTSHEEYMAELKADEYRRNNKVYNSNERNVEYFLKLNFTLEKAVLFASWGRK